MFIGWKIDDAVNQIHALLAQKKYCRPPALLRMRQAAALFAYWHLYLRPLSELSNSFGTTSRANS